MVNKTTRQHVLDTVDDLVGKFLYYDRKNDEDLPLGAIEEAIRSGEVTTEEITERFKTVMRLHI